MKRVREFLDILKQIKHESPQPIFCPKCRSHNIYPKDTYGLFPSTYSCRDCGYEGNVVFELDLEDKDETPITP